MKITIKPETEEEKSKFKLIEYENIYEFGICGHYVLNDIIHKPFSHSLSVGKEVNRLIGQLEQMKEELRDFKNGFIKQH